MKRWKKLAAAAAALLVSATAACGAGESATGADGTLKIAFHLAPASLDPLQVSIWQLMTYEEPMYDTVTRIDPDGNVQPMLATSWTFGDKAIDFTFRQDVKFHDGTPFDAQAFKVNMDRLLAAKKSPVASMFTAVTGAEVTGQYTARLKLSRMDSALPAALGDRGGVMISPKAIADGVDLSRQDAGSGPYRLIDYKAGDHAVYERFPGYWDPKAAVAQHLQIDAVGDGQARLNGAISRQYDITYLTPSQFDAAKGAGLGVEQKTGLWFINIFTNRTRSQLGNLQARQAIAHAIDRDAICAAVYFGRCKPTSSIFPSDFWGGSPEAGPNYDNYDPALSRKLLADAGLPQGFEFTMLYAAGADPYPQLAELLQSQLAAVGIKLNLKPVDINQLSPVYFVEKNADAMLGGGGQVADPGQSLQKEFRSGATLNPSGDAPGGLDAVIDSLNAATSRPDRERLSRQATEIATEQVLNVPLVQPEVLFAYNPDKLTGYEASYVGAYAPTRGAGG